MSRALPYPHAQILLIFVWLLATFTVKPTAAHQLSVTDVVLVLKTNGTYQADLLCDLDALALGVSAEADSAELAATLRQMTPGAFAQQVEKLQRLFERRVRLRFDGQAVTPQVSFPDFGMALADAADIPTVLGLTARLYGAIPEDAAEVTFSASRAFPPVHLTVLDQGATTIHRELLEQGATSAPYVLGGGSGDDGDSAAQPLPVMLRYLALGFHHIVPAGLDHILFVLALFLLSAHWRPLLIQVSAFTAAHTLTLALASNGVVTLPPRIVEPLIAVSIAWVAVENLWARRLGPWRPWLVFAFGLLHGLGFAGVLGELGLPDGDKLTALVAFNIGVELGQLAVIAGAFLVLGWFRQRSWYRRRLVLPLSLLIAATGLFWAVTRIWTL